MNLKALILGIVLVLGMGNAAQAQLIDGNSIDEIMRIARTYGTASLESQSSGAPKITLTTNGLISHVSFFNCTNNRDCEDINFYAGFEVKPTLETINSFNREKRFVKAWLDSSLDAVLELDVNLQSGIDRRNLDSLFSLWSTVLDQYAVYIGYK